MPMTLSTYIVQLQALEAAGHGDLPVCLFDDENGWDARREEDPPRLETGHYTDETSTSWRWKQGLFIVA